MYLTLNQENTAKYIPTFVSKQIGKEFSMFPLMVQAFRGMHANK